MTAGLEPCEVAVGSLDLASLVPVQAVQLTVHITVLAAATLLPAVEARVRQPIEYLTPTARPPGA